MLMRIVGGLRPDLRGLRALSLAILLPTVALLSAPAAASATFIHTVAPGESLSSVAAVDGLAVEQLAAANGLSPNAELLAGSQLVIPPQEAAEAIESASSLPEASTSASSEEPRDYDADDGATTQNAPAERYVVQPGDTLTAIAARYGTTVAQLAAANGLDPNAPLLYGTTVLVGASTQSVPVATPVEASAAISQPVGEAAEGSPSGPPYPTEEFVSPEEVASIAEANGVPASLANAIAYQESGFNNDLISPSNARGVMQITPGTWSWISEALAGTAPPAPESALENVRAGVLLLHSLLQATGGNEGLATAGYFQGLPSVLEHGEDAETHHYVEDVQALQQRFGGG